MITNAFGVPEIKDINTLLYLLPNTNFIKSIRKLLRIGSKITSFFSGFKQFNAANDYNLNDAWVLADACNLVYEEDSSFVKSELANIGFTLIKILHEEKMDGDCFIAEKDDILWVIFRGTEPTDLKDWITDLKSMTHYIGTARVHLGFHNSAQALFEKKVNEDSTLLEYLKNVNSKKKRIYFAGHSLGGALAAYTAWYMTKPYDDKGSYRKPFIDRDKILVYTYGAPNVGNSTFASEVQSLIHRFAYNQDIVARIPKFGEYKPAGTLHFISPDGRITTPERLTDISLDALGNIATLLESLFNFSIFFDLEKSIQILRPLLDHSLEYYCAHLRNANEWGLDSSKGK